MSGASSQPDFGSRTEFYTFAPESLADALPDFDIVKEVGRGSMGLVYEAVERASQRRVAIKVLPPSLTLTERALARFLREGEIMAKIRHPGIVEVYDHGRRDRLHWFVMEFVDGLNLDERLRIGPLPIRQTAEIGERVARAVQFAHDRGIVHRDIKPSNLILREDGSVAITDFGLARETGSGSMTESGAIIGTPMFMAPEQVTGDYAVTTRADVYGLGATLYTLLTGRPPFVGRNAQHVLRQVVDHEPTRPSRLRAELPRDLEAIVLTALEKDPTRRYGSAEELADELARFLAGDRVRARTPGPLARISRLARKQRLLVSLLVLVIALGSAAVWLRENLRQGEIEAELAKASRLVARAASARDEQLKPLDESRRRELLQAALASASSVIERDPAAARAWFVRAQAHHQLRAFRDARFDLDTAERIHGRPTPEVLHYRIDVLKSLWDTASRRQLHSDLRDLLEIDPSPYNRCIVAFHLLDLARAATDDADRAEILDRATSIIEPVPLPDASAAVVKARILELRGEVLAAIAAIRDAAESFRGNPLVHEEAAAMLLRCGYDGEGDEHVRLLQILDPGRSEDGDEPPAAPADGKEVQRFLQDLRELLQSGR